MRAPPPPAPPTASLAATAEALARAAQAAQLDLDRASLEIAGFMAGEAPPGVDPRVRVGGLDATLFELGFTPTFHQAVEVDIEVRVDVQMTTEGTASQSTGSTRTRTHRVGGWLFGATRAVTRTVDARDTSRYGTHIAASSVLHTRLVPTPSPPPLLDLMDAERARRAKEAP